MVTTPETTHAISSQNGEFTVREISADTMKIPDPIIEPATSMVASVSVSALMNSRDDGAVPAVAAWVVNALPPPGTRFLVGVSSWYRGRELSAKRRFC